MYATASSLSGMMIMLKMETVKYKRTAARRLYSHSTIVSTTDASTGPAKVPIPVMLARNRITMDSAPLTPQNEIFFASDFK